MRRFRCWPPTIGSIVRCVAIAPTRDGYACEFNASRGGAESNIIGMVVRQSRIAHTLHNAEAPDHLHSARRDVVALYTRQFIALALLSDDDIDATPGKIHRQRRADRTAAHDQHARSDAPQLRVG